MLINLLKTHKLWIVVTYCLVCLLTTYLAEQNIHTEEIYRKSFAKVISADFGSITYHSHKDNAWVNYLTPLLNIFRFIPASFLIILGMQLTNIRIPLNYIFQATILGEIIFLIPEFAKTVYFPIFISDFTLKGFRDFSLFSLASIFDYENLKYWEYYPLRVINLFEVIYCAFIAIVLDEFILNRDKSFGLVFISYWSGLLIWVLIVVFISLEFLS
jgi:hypothetical protein